MKIMPNRFLLILLPLLFAACTSAPKKDLALLAMDYENVYIARVAYGAKDIQTMHAFHEAEAFPGPSLIIAYSPCIAHGIDLKDNHLHLL